MSRCSIPRDDSTSDWDSWRLPRRGCTSAWSGSLLVENRLKKWPFGYRADGNKEDLELPKSLSFDQVAPLCKGGPLRPPKDQAEWRSLTTWVGTTGHARRVNQRDGNRLAVGDV